MRSDVEGLLSRDLAALDVPALQREIDRLRLLVGRLTGRLDEALGVLAERSEGQVPDRPDRAPDTPGLPLCRSVSSWWRDTATVTGQQAGRDLRRAAVLRDLPVLAAAVVDGRLAPAQAAVLCRLHGRIPEADLIDSQEQLVTVAAGMNPEVLGQWVRHLIATHCEPALELEQAKAHDRRYLQLVREPDGTTRGRFVLADEDAEVLLTVLEPLARRQGGQDQRSAGQRRADALVDVCAGASRWADLPHAGGQRPQVSYVVQSDWCADERAPALSEQLSRQGVHPRLFEDYAGAGAWTGPQTRARIESVLCDARISRLVLDARGEVVALHSLSDEITTAQRRTVSARDRHCVASGCNRPPAFCDVHHLEHREHGGATEVHNLVLLCRRHHVAWHRGAIGRQDLHVPWLSDASPHDPWATHSPPQVA